MSECSKCGVGYFLPSSICDHCGSPRSEVVTKTFIGKLDGDGESFMWSDLPRADRKRLVPHDDVDVIYGDRLDTLYPCELFATMKLDFETKYRFTISAEKINE